MPCTDDAATQPGPSPSTGVTDCQVALAAHQVRIHGSSSSSIFLDVGSNPVIEHCSAMGFGALTPQQRELLGMSESAVVQTAAAGSSAAPFGRTDGGSAGAVAVSQAQPTGAAAGTAAGGSSSCWRAVQDFNWLRSTPSPNWWALADAHTQAMSAIQPMPNLTQSSYLPSSPHFSCITSASSHITHTQQPVC
jgi:Tubulin binding cofactor C